MKEPLYILDGYGLIYRSYFAFMKNPLFNSKGENTSAVFGFYRTLFSFIDTFHPSYFVVAMDSITPTFRHEMYPEYKTTRDKTPEDLHAQIPVIENILDALGITRFRHDGVEADDIMAAFAERCRKEKRPCFIISGDKDLLQMVDDSVRILVQDKGQFREVDREGVHEKFGIYPEQVMDYLSLVGDSSDNVPGVKGIGPKSAVQLLEKYGNLDSIYEHLDALTKGQKSKMEESRDDAFLSRRLVELKTDVPVPGDLEALSMKEFDPSRAAPLFLEQDMKALVRDIGTAGGDTGAGAAGSAPQNGEGASGAGKCGAYTLVTTEEELSQWVKRVKENTLFAFDCETDSINPRKAVPVGFSISTGGEQGCYIPLTLPDKECLPEKSIRAALETILTDDKLKCIGQNIKYDYQVCLRWGIGITNIHWDTMIAAWLLEAGSSYGMDRLAERFLNYRTIHFGDVVEKGKTFDSVPSDKALAYAAEDADITYRLYEIFEPRLKEEGLDKLMSDMEIPLIPVLARMELEGIGIDAERLRTFSEELGKKLESVEKEIYSLCGEEFNINSTKQLQEILFGKRQLQPIKKTKTGYSTDTYVLEELAKEDPVPGKVLEHRSMSKLKSTYVDTLPQLADEESGRIHTTFIQTGTATGRIASRDPNLQNIPIKTEEGRKIRNAFIPREGCLFISADYSQIELVVLAHLSQDPELCEAFRNGEDIHRRTAGLIFEVPGDDVTPEQRRIAKTINFGIMYGMSGFRLSRELGIQRRLADDFISSYFEKYSSVKDFIAETVKKAEETGRSQTMFGRSRPIPGINSKNRTEKNGAERIAVNTPIQGSAADIVKIAMLELARILPGIDKDIRMLLQVHDELIFEVPEASCNKAEESIRRVMENAVELSVPLRVGVESGKSWGELH